MEEPMTDYQFKTLLKMILDILKNSNDIQEAVEKIQKLLDEKK